MTVEKEAGEELWRQRLRQVVSGHGGPTIVAKLSGVPLQTLRNHLSGRTRKRPVENLHAIAEACGVSAAWLSALDDGAEDAGQADGFAEGDLTAYHGPPPGLSEKPPTGHGYWQVENRALELAAILPGDVLDFAIGERPRKGDVVVAQVYDPDGRSARTVLRLFNPPFLTVHTQDRNLDQTPIQIDANEERVKVMGTLVALSRRWKR